MRVGAEGDRDGGSALGGAWPSARRDPRLARMESNVGMGSVSVGGDGGGGEGDDSIHSSPRSSVCHAGNTEAILYDVVVVVVIGLEYERKSRVNKESLDNFDSGKAFGSWVTWHIFDSSTLFIFPEHVRLHL